MIKTVYDCFKSQNTKKSLKLQGNSDKEPGRPADIKEPESVHTKAPYVGRYQDSGK